MFHHEQEVCESCISGTLEGGWLGLAGKGWGHVPQILLDHPNCM